MKTDKLHQAILSIRAMAGVKDPVALMKVVRLIAKEIKPKTVIDKTNTLAALALSIKKELEKK